MKTKDPNPLHKEVARDAHTGEKMAGASQECSQKFHLLSQATLLVKSLVQSTWPFLFRLSSFGKDHLTATGKGSLLNRPGPDGTV